MVAKIEKNYNGIDPDDVGFNVFWILFPFFLFFGLILCCCVMLIFGARPVEMEDEKEEEDEQDPENPPVKNDKNEGGVAVSFVDPVGPSKEAELTVESITATEEQINEPASEKSQPSDPPSEDNMDDLD